MYFIYLQLTIRWQINILQWSTVLQITIFDTKIEYFLPRKNLPICKPKSPYLCPRKYHIYANKLFTFQLNTNLTLTQINIDQKKQEQTSPTVLPVLLWPEFKSNCLNIQYRKFPKYLDTQKIVVITC